MKSKPAPVTKLDKKHLSKDAKAITPNGSSRQSKTTVIIPKAVPLHEADITNTLIRWMILFSMIGVLLLWVMSLWFDQIRLPAEPAYFIFVLMPFLAVFIDTVAAARAKSQHYKLGNTHHYDFSVIVPIYGNMKYLENADYLSQYGNKVILCTTGTEAPEFYDAFKKICQERDFRYFIDAPTDSSKAKSMTKLRATSGTIRDRLIRNVLESEVKTTYVVPIDADTLTPKPLSLLVGELVKRNLDIASIRLILANPDESLLTRLQNHEYQLAMQLRFVAPWMISGACHVAKTSVLRDIMHRHSLFFQGNDVEVGLIAVSRGYKIGHIPFEVSTAVPATLRNWYRQRLAWAGGEFRLFLPNFRFVIQHPFFWVYGGILSILVSPLRWISLAHPSVILLEIFGLYALIRILLHWSTRDRWLLLMPIYTLFSSLIMTPIGIPWYFVMAKKDKNMGIIRPKNVSPINWYRLIIRAFLGVLVIGILLGNYGVTM